MPADYFDQASRYLLRQDTALTGWLLGLRADQFTFVRWLDTRRLAWPGQPDRTNDTVAFLYDLARNSLPWAIVFEFQIDPDPDMLARLLVYLGMLLGEIKPADLPGDRFEVGAVVVNLRKKGNTSRRMRWSDARLETTLRIRERNLATLDAGQLLRQVASGAVPRLALAWLPLMKRGDQPGMIKRWLELASQETQAERRRGLGTAEVFAEAAGCRPVWRDALTEWSKMESQVVKEWTASAALSAARETLLDVLESRFGSRPAELQQALLAATDLAQLRQWARLAGKAASLQEALETIKKARP